MGWCFGFDWRRCSIEAMRVLRIFRITVAVGDVAAARATFERLFGATLAHAGDIPAFDVRAAELALGEDTVQLAEPASADNPVARFLARKGEGFYNVALEVDDLDAAVVELRAQGVRVSEPVEAEPGVRSAFMAMAATHGLSVQLVEVLGSRAAEAAGAEAEDATVEQRLLDLTPEEWSDED
jgi:methylmalonyl-CoA epimerase